MTTPDTEQIPILSVSAAEFCPVSLPVTANVSPSYSWSRHHPVKTAAVTVTFASSCAPPLTLFPLVNRTLLNGTSLAKPNAVQLLHTELVQLDCDCALITETWYTKKHQDTLVGIPNYTLFRRDRLRGKGGGVCAYVRSSITCSVFVSGVGAQSTE